MSIKSKLYIAFSIIILFALIIFVAISTSTIKTFSGIHFIRGVATGMTAVTLVTSFMLLIKKAKNIGLSKIFYNSESLLMLMVFSLSCSLILLLYDNETAALTIIGALFAGLAGLLNGWFVRKQV